MEVRRDWCSKEKIQTRERGDGPLQVKTMDYKFLKHEWKLVREMENEYKLIAPVFRAPHMIQRVINEIKRNPKYYILYRAIT